MVLRCLEWAGSGTEAQTPALGQGLFVEIRFFYGNCSQVPEIVISANLIVGPG